MDAAFEQKLRSAFETYRLEDVRLVGEVKLLVSGRRDVLFEQHKDDGLALARGLSDTVDCLLRAYLNSCDAAKGLALLALGGYGRGELSPHSDVDVLVLYPKGSEKRARELTGPFLAFLWDVGHVVGHASRTVEQCREVMDIDLPSATAMLEGRFVGGSRVLFRSFVETVTDPWIAENADDFIEQKIDEARARHDFYGGSPLLAVPNVKESAGGLRDVHVAGWIATALSGRKDFKVYREAGLLDEDASEALLRAYGEVQRVRHVLHRIAGVKQDALDFAARREAAAMLGYEDGEGFSASERLLGDYYRSALPLARFLHRVIRFRRGCPADAVPRRVSKTLVEVGGDLYPAEEGAVESVEDAFGAAAVLAREDLRPSPELTEALETLTERIGDAERSDPVLARGFLDLLLAPGAGRGLRALERAGLLGAYLPEFGRLSCLSREDPAHQYTVDEHTLRAVEALDTICAEGNPAREELLRVARPDLLRLSLLLHDIGKASGAPHVPAGVAMVPEVTRRLCLTEEEARLVLILVAGHLMLTELADTRVPGEAAESLADRVPDRSVLRNLFLLTLADVSAAGRGALTGWREAQLRRLYADARERLSPKPSVPFLFRVLEVAGEERREEAREHLLGMGTRYALEVEPSRAALHLDLVGRLADEPAALAFLAAPTHGEVWVGARDDRGLVARIAGVLNVNDLDIASAQAYTRADGVAVDGFIVTREGGPPPDDDAFWREVSEDLAAAVRSSVWLDRRLDRFRRRFRPEPPPAPPGRPPGASASSLISDRHTVVEVAALDRPLLLHDLAREVARRDLSIHHAIIATRGRMVHDTFYVSRDDGEKPSEEELGPLLDGLSALTREDVGRE